MSTAGQVTYGKENGTRIRGLSVDCEGTCDMYASQSILVSAVNHRRTCVSGIGGWESDVVPVGCLLMFARECSHYHYFAAK